MTQRPPHIPVPNLPPPASTWEVVIQRTTIGGDVVNDVCRFCDAGAARRGVDVWTNACSHDPNVVEFAVTLFERLAAPRGQFTGKGAGHGQANRP